MQALPDWGKVRILQLSAAGLIKKQTANKSAEGKNE